MTKATLLNPTEVHLFTQGGQILLCLNKIPPMTLRLAVKAATAHFYCL